MDIKEIITKYKESPATYRERLEGELTCGYEYEWQRIENYQGKVRYTALTLILALLSFALLTVLSALPFGIYCLAVLGGALYIASAITAPIITESSDGRKYALVAYIMLAAFYFEFGFFGAAIFDETAWAWLAILFGVGAIIVNLIVRLVYKSDLITTLRWTIPLFALFDATVVRAIATAAYKREETEIKKKCDAYDKEFLEATEKLAPVFEKSKFILDASEYFEGEIMKLVKMYNPKEDDEDEETVVETELVADFSGFRMCAKVLGFERAKIQPPEAAVELAGLARALTWRLTSYAFPYANELAEKNGKKAAIEAEYIHSTDGTLVQISLNIWNPEYDALGSIYDTLDEALGGKT